MFEKRRPGIGARPGTIVLGEGALRPRIHLIRYSETEVHEQEVDGVAKLREALQSGDFAWIDVQGLGDETLIRQIADVFSLHPLALEDVVNVPSRPKAEPYDQQLLIITRMVRMDEAGTLIPEQVGIVVGLRYVLTFQERYGDVLDPVRHRIRAGNGQRIRREGSSYLAYAIFDTIIDAYYPVLESIGTAMESLEDAVISNPTPHALNRLHQLKKTLAQLRRALWPQREAVNSLIRDDNPLVSIEVRMFLRDTYDHCVQLSEVTEMYREVVAGLLNTYLSSVANRTNEVMKVLTIVATIFIPLTFVAAIYGMNFEHMPELHLKWAYPATWAAMIALAAGMLIFFRKKGWIGSSQRSPDRADRGEN